MTNTSEVKASGSKQVLHHIEVAKLATLMAAHLSMIAGTPYCVYEDGWSDEKIAEASGTRATLKHVVNLRKELYGDFQPPENALPLGKDPRVDTLIKEVNGLRIDLIHIKTLLGIN